MAVQLEAGLGRAWVGSGPDDPLAILRRITRGALHVVDGAEVAAIDLVDPWGELVAVCVEGAPAEQLQLRRDSLSGLAFATRHAQRCDDAETDPRVDRAACRAVGARSLVTVPLVHCDATVGVITVASSRLAAFDDSVIDVLTELGGFLSAVVATAVATDGPERQRGLVRVGAADSGGPGVRTPSGAVDTDRVAAFVTEVLSPGAADTADTHRRILDALERRAVTMVFQPVVELARERVVAVEALARFDGPPHLPPDAWFADAHAAGLGTELELLAIEQALDVLDHLPSKLLVGVNASPRTLASPSLHHLLSAVDGNRVAVEITEHMAVDDYAHLRRRLTALRDLGVRLAVDDTGSGYASFRHILSLSPEFIKLDLALTKGIDTDPARRALAAALVGFVSQSGAQLVAEGIETEAELATVRELGIPFAQGYHLGRPAPFATLDVPSRRR